jgi:hypothetical protein
MFYNSKETNPVTAKKAEQIMLNTTYNEKKLLLGVCMCVRACAIVCLRAFGSRNSSENSRCLPETTKIGCRTLNVA